MPVPAYMASNSWQTSPISCDLSVLSGEEFLRRKELYVFLTQLVEEIYELEDGYVFRYQTDGSTWGLVAEFITLEGRCCPFLHFRLEQQAETGTVWLTMFGRSGVKAYLEGQLRIR